MKTMSIPVDPCFRLVLQLQRLDQLVDAYRTFRRQKVHTQDDTHTLRKLLQRIRRLAGATNQTLADALKGGAA